MRRAAQRPIALCHIGVAEHKRIVRAIGADPVVVVDDGNGTHSSHLAIDTVVRGYRVRFYPRARRFSPWGETTACARLVVTR